MTIGFITIMMIVNTITMIIDAIITIVMVVIDKR